ncbi:hypothetical protein [Stenotrophomonas sp. PS02289]|uniref:hypothetical protein n=1 Tax=Stenotrophomonas sp. PS02289 TaxID=2991422 RepID=UPI00249A09BD|nr:hypothetical protein [Stenotrophomonas sp. PS02289]
MNMDFFPPSNWQDFERLTRLLCEAEWSDIYAVTVGRPGQAQNGIDVVGWDYRVHPRLRTGVQCKRRSQASSDGTVLAGGLVNLEDVKSCLGAIKKIKVPLGHLVMATTASQDVTFQNQIDELNVMRVAQGECEVSIWFWEWYQEKLNRHLGVAATCYPRILAQNNMYNVDMNVAAVLRHGFDRVFMKTPFRSENQIGGVVAAIESMHGLLATGLLRDAQKQLVLSCAPPIGMREGQDRNSVARLQELVRVLRDDVTGCLARNDIYDAGGGWIILSDLSIGERLDRQRAEILVELNGILRRNGVDPVESPLLSLEGA